MVYAMLKPVRCCAMFSIVSIASVPSAALAQHILCGPEPKVAISSLARSSVYKQADSLLNWGSVEIITNGLIAFRQTVYEAYDPVAAPARDALTTWIVCRRALGDPLIAGDTADMARLLSVAQSRVASSGRELSIELQSPPSDDAAQDYAWTYIVYDPNLVRNVHHSITYGIRINLEFCSDTSSNIAFRVGLPAAGYSTSSRRITGRRILEDFGLFYRTAGELGSRVQAAVINQTGSLCWDSSEVADSTSWVEDAPFFYYALINVTYEQNDGPERERKYYLRSTGRDEQLSFVEISSTEFDEFSQTVVESENYWDDGLNSAINEFIQRYSD